MSNSNSIISGAELIAGNISHSILYPPHYVGGWQISPHVLINATERPNWFRRTMHRLLLGWKWVDAE